LSHGLSLILPCLNEAQAVPVVLQKLLQTKIQILATTKLTDIEIIVVDDGSTDSSVEELRKFGNQIQVISHGKCKGYGRALKTGFEASKHSLIAFYDLDDTCQPLDLIPMINAATKNDVGMVSGYRMAQNTQMPLVRFIGNTFYKNLTRALLKTSVGDCCSGFRLFHRRYKDQFIEILPDNLNFTLAMTIAFLRQKGTYLEVPIQYEERRGDSKLIPMIHGPLFLGTLLRYSLSPKFSYKRLSSLPTSL